MTAAPQQGAPAGGRAVFGAAIKGGRTDQQDSFRLCRLDGEGGWLLLLADGMGGHAAGALASKIAADTFVAAFRSLRAEGTSLADALGGALTRANEAIAAAQRLDPDNSAGMGTTVVAAHLAAGGVSWISVGDSPLWLYRRGELRRLNEDHSLRQFAGEGAPSGNILQSAVMGEPKIPLVDSHPEPERLEPDDLVLLSSDGILTLDEQQIAATISSASGADAELIAWLLLNAVQDRKKSRKDNCTLIVARASAAGIASAPIAAGASRGGRTRWIAAALLVLGAGAATAAALLHLH